MLRLAIDWRPARIGLEFHPAVLEIQHAYHTMRLDEQPAILDIEIEQPRVELDLTEPMAEIGLRSSLRIAEDLATQGWTAAHEGVAKTAREGDELAAVHRGVNGIALYAAKAWPFDQRQLNVDLAPKSRVGVTAYGGIEIDYRPGAVSVEIVGEPVTVSYRRGVVRSYIAVKEAIKIDVVGDAYSIVA